MFLQYLYIMIYNTLKSMPTSLLTSLIQKCTFFVNADHSITTLIYYILHICDETTGLTGFKAEHCNDMRMRCTISFCSNSLSFMLDNGEL